jgi:hypothetical protein
MEGRIQEIKTKIEAQKKAADQRVAYILDEIEMAVNKRQTSVWFHNNFSEYDLLAIEKLAKDFNITLTNNMVTTGWTVSW